MARLKIFLGAPPRWPTRSARAPLSNTPTKLSRPAARPQGVDGVGCLLLQDGSRRSERTSIHRPPPALVSPVKKGRCQGGVAVAAVKGAPSPASTSLRAARRSQRPPSVGITSAHRRRDATRPGNKRGNNNWRDGGGRGRRLHGNGASREREGEIYKGDMKRRLISRLLALLGPARPPCLLGFCS